MGIYIEGFGMRGYRSFGNKMQRIGPLSKVNIFAGRNNSGKSNVISFLTNCYAPMLRFVQGHNQQPSLSDLDRPLKDWDGTRSIEFGISIGGSQFDLIAQQMELDGRARNFLHRVLSSDVLSMGTGTAWLPFDLDSRQSTRFSANAVQRLAAAIPHITEWQQLWKQATRQGGGDLKSHWIPESLHRLVFLMPTPTISIIPSVRRYSTEKSESSDDFSGTGIIDKLAKLQNPSYKEQNLKDSFEMINNFIRTVTGNLTATLEIPHDRGHILVHMDGKTLPLSSLGTGIHEVVILASAATILHDQIMCIEEPELHMHPELQKKLVDYLEYQTTNQYFITTHSASILDRPNMSIFHVSMTDGLSQVVPVSSPAARFAVCADLGYRASDLVQCNCIVWVEGPSDRLYLKWWINALDPTLVEGIHYSIMFYGGRLLSHLSANDPEVDEFISLRRLNRNVAILIDSDRKSGSNEINDTKKRVKQELEDTGGVAWVTAGREIENYLDRVALEQAAREVVPSITGFKYRTKFDDPLKAITAGGGVIEPDKVKLARKMAEGTVCWEVLDLEERCRALVSFIRLANRLPER